VFSAVRRFLDVMVRQTDVMQGGLPMFYQAEINDVIHFSTAELKMAV
jgi:hypothetical protein